MFWDIKMVAPSLELFKGQVGWGFVQTLQVILQPGHSLSRMLVSSHSSSTMLSKIGQWLWLLGRTLVTALLQFIFKWQKLTELIEMLKQETRLQIGNRNVELRKEYQHLVRNSLRAQFPFYANTSALSHVIFRQYMKWKYHQLLHLLIKSGKS